MDVQADLSLCWLHKSYCRFCHTLAQFVSLLVAEDREKESLKIVLKVGGNKEQSPDVYSQSSHDEKKHKHKKKKKKKSGERDKDRSRHFGV